MPKVSVNILTKDRAELLKKALDSVISQSFKDFEIVIVNDGSIDGTTELLKDLKFKDLKIIVHPSSVGITKSRQEALDASGGEFIAILDDDDQWSDVDKLKKQVQYLDAHPDVVIAGGAISINSKSQIPNPKTRPAHDGEIRNTMLFRNNFFTSSVMFRRQAALDAGGFISDEDDLAEDYDLWLRMAGKVGCIISRKPLSIIGFQVIIATGLNGF